MSPRADLIRMKMNLFTYPKYRKLTYLNGDVAPCIPNSEKEHRVFSDGLASTSCVLEWSPQTPPAPPVMYLQRRRPSGWTAKILPSLEAAYTTPVFLSSSTSPSTDALTLTCHLRVPSRLRAMRRAGSLLSWRVPKLIDTCQKRPIKEQKGPNDTGIPYRNVLHHGAAGDFLRCIEAPCLYTCGVEVTESTHSLSLLPCAVRRNTLLYVNTFF